MRDANVLILDEPTSALDAESAAAVQDTVLNMFKGKTVVMVTHDLALTKRVDQIIVMEEDNLVATGTYDGLTDTCPLFKNMAATQWMESRGVELSW